MTGCALPAWLTQIVPARSRLVHRHSRRSCKGICSLFSLCFLSSGLRELLTTCLRRGAIIWRAGFVERRMDGRGFAGLIPFLRSHLSLGSCGRSWPTGFSCGRGACGSGPEAVGSWFQGRQHPANEPRAMQSRASERGWASLDMAFGRKGGAHHGFGTVDLTNCDSPKHLSWFLLASPGGRNGFWDGLTIHPDLTHDARRPGSRTRIWLPPRICGAWRGDLKDHGKPEVPVGWRICRMGQLFPISARADVPVPPGVCVHMPADRRLCRYMDAWSDYALMTAWWRHCPISSFVPIGDSTPTGPCLIYACGHLVPGWPAAVHRRDCRNIGGPRMPD